MKIILFADVPGWAWDIKARALKENLPQFDIDVAYSHQVHGINLTKYDAVHFFGWKEAFYIGDVSKVTCGISSFNFQLLHQETNQDLNKFAAIAAVSGELYHKLKKEKINSHIYSCFNGVDENKFFPDKKKNNNKFVIGWVGQETNGGFEKRPVDIKGYQHVLLPLAEKLKHHHNIELKIIANNHTNSISHDDMPMIYNQFDLFLSTSFLEGTPNPAFEASACGIPVLSTGVGCLPELITNNKNGILIDAYKNAVEAKRSVDVFYDKILYLAKHKELCQVMGNYNRIEIEKNWTWKKRAKQWIPVFNNHRFVR